MKEKLSYISNNIRSYRIRSGLTQREVADKLGVSRITYNIYEVNPKKVRIETLQQIALIFNCNLMDFFVQPKVAESNIEE